MIELVLYIILGALVGFAYSCLALCTDMGENFGDRIGQYIAEFILLILGFWGAGSSETDFCTSAGYIAGDFVGVIMIFLNIKRDNKLWHKK